MGNTLQLLDLYSEIKNLEMGEFWNHINVKNVRLWIHLNIYFQILGLEYNYKQLDLNY